MGNCESTNKTNQNQQYNSKELNPVQGNSQRNPLNTINKSGYESSKIKENYDGDTAKVPVNDIPKIIKSICKVIYKENNILFQGTGFFMLINDIKYLITNYHNIKENLISQIINIEIFNNHKISMKLDINNRHIQFFKNIDITIIEIKESDDIIKDIDFLNYDLNYIGGYEQYKNMDIFTLEYSKDEIDVITGKIKDILNDFEFKHNIHTEQASSGSPIILSNSLKVIGIHKEGDRDAPINYGSFIGEIFKEYKYFKNIQNIDINNNYIIGEIYISKDNIGVDIRIINSYEEYYREINIKDIKEEYKNENEIKECIIEINGKNYPFSYFHKFEKEGKHQIKYTFKKLLTNCGCMFSHCLSLINLNLSKFNTQNVTNMNSMFSHCSSLNALNLSNFNTQNVIDMFGMFYKCSSLINLNLSNFNTKIVIDMSWMFKDCSSLKNLNLSNFNTQNVTNMSGMFSNCSSLIKLTLSNFNTKIVIDMSWMFFGCISLNDLNLSNFNTQNVTNMSFMFSHCSSLKVLNLSNFNTQNVNNMCEMFSFTSSLKDLNLSTFSTQNVTDMSGMFLNCNSLRKNCVITYESKILKELK